MNLNRLTPRQKQLLSVLGIIIILVAGFFLLRANSTQNQPGATLKNEHAETGAPTLLTKLPYQTDHFRISYDSQAVKYLIVPVVSIDPNKSPTQEFIRVWPTYQQYGQEAINWIKSQGIDPHSIDIEWWGQEWWPEGRTISY